MSFFTISGIDINHFVTLIIGLISGLFLTVVSSILTNKVATRKERRKAYADLVGHLVKLNPKRHINKNEYKKTISLLAKASTYAPSHIELEIDVFINTIEDLIREEFELGDNERDNEVRFQLILDYLDQNRTLINKLKKDFN